MRTVFTTGQVAKIAKVAPRTVSKWFDSGRLKGYRIPGSQDRRIPRDKLIAFFKENGMPQGDELEAASKVNILTIGLDPALKDVVKIDDDSKLVVTHASGLFDAALSVNSANPPKVVILDSYSLSGDLIRDGLDSIRKDELFEDAVVVVVTGEDGVSQFDGADLTFQRPFDVMQLSAKLKLYTHEEAA
jgi:excisionase family DNA binding protein